MLRQNRSCGVLAAAKKQRNKGSHEITNGEKIHQNPFSDKNYKRGYSAEGYSLLTSALRPRLFGSGEGIEDSIKDDIESHSYGFVRLASLVLSGIAISFIVSQFSINNTYAASITLTLPDNGVKLDITPSSNSTFTKSSASTYSVKSDAPFGYTLSIKAKDSSNSNDLVNSTSGLTSSPKLTSISNATSEANFSSSGANNTWGYLPSKLNSNDNTNFQPGPSSNNDTVLDKTSSANSNTNNDYTIVLGAKIDSNTIAGNYTNTFIMSATANSVSYNITYNLNSGSWSGTSPQSGTTTANTVTLDTHSPSKSGYTFRGWCSSNSITNQNSTSTPSCTGTQYGAGGTYTLTGATNTLNLYAMWQQNITYRSFTITYRSNVGSPSSMPSTQYGSASSTNNYYDNLSWNNPTLSGYTFQGWCTNSTSTESCSGTSYQPGNSIYISYDGYSLTLYAMWKKNLSNGDSCSHSGWSGTAKYYGGYCWMWTDYKTGRTWAQANSDCPSGWHLPSKAEFESLINATVNGGALRSIGWTTGNYWSSTEYASANAYNLYIYSGGASVGYHLKNVGYYVRCVAD